jgi:uridine phosphorylase
MPGESMRSDQINHAFLDPVVAGEQRDIYYHLGVASDDPVLDQLRDLRAIVMAGSGARMDDFASRWSRDHGDAPIIAFPKEDRFITRYTAGVLFVSHGMGMPSASIAVQELMRLAYFLTRGDLDALDRIFWARVGTSGGVGLQAGTIVVTTEALMADLKPYRLLDGAGGYHWFDGHFPRGIADDIVRVNEGSGIPIALGKTVATNEFFIEQFRLDGAIALTTPELKADWLRRLDEHGVRNIEMEGALIAAYLNYWGFSRFAMVCTTLLNRLQGDQVTSSPEQMHAYAERAGDVLFTYLRTLD